MSGQFGVYQPRLQVPVIEGPRQREPDVSSGLLQVAGALDQIGKQRDATELIQAKTDAAGKLADLKLETLRQPWQAREQFYNDQSAKVFQELQQHFSGQRSAAMFANEWEGLYRTNLIDVKTSAYQGEKDQNIANLDQSLSDYAQQAATAGSDAQSNAIHQSAAGQIAAAVGGGWTTQEDGGKMLREFSRKVDQNRARILIDANPSTAMRALNDLAQFKNLRVEDRISLQERADSKMQHQVAMADHAIIVNERNRKLAGDQLAKEGEDLIAQGKMTEDWMQAHRTTLDPSDYRILRHSMQEGGGTDSSAFLADTYQRLYVDVEDVGSTVVDALRNRVITGPTAKAILNENQQTQGVQSPRIQGLKYITGALKVSDLNPDPAAAQRQVDAIAEFNRQLKADPKADPMTLARDITKRYALIDFQNMTLTAPLPRYAVGGRKDLDVQATVNATWANYLQKHGGDRAAALADPEFIREAALLKRWKESIDKQHALQNAAPGGVK